MSDYRSDAINYLAKRNSALEDKLAEVTAWNENKVSMLIQAYTDCEKWKARADLPPTREQIMADERVQALVEAVRRMHETSGISWAARDALAALTESP